MPNAKAIIARENDKANDFNAFTNLRFIIESNKSWINVEKVLKLPRKPIIKNNTDSDEKFKNMSLDKIEINRPSRKDEKVLINKIII